MTHLVERLQRVRTTMVLAAVLVAAGSLIYAHQLTRALYHEEERKMQVWAEAMRSLTVADETTDLNLVLRVINSNHTIPVVVTDDHGHVTTYRNLRPHPSGKDSLRVLNEAVKRMQEEGQTMKVDVGEYALTVCYTESVLIHRLRLYPYVQLGVVSILVCVALMALMAFKRAEQDRLWVGLSRETAHQLGTPLSSLMAWSEMLREAYPGDALIPELEQDVQRLQLIAERFSKIGSAPELTVQDLTPVVQRVAAYVDRRTSRKVTVSVEPPPHPLPVHLNAPLMEWVIENLCRNAVDAMQGEGSITLRLRAVASGAHLEVTDTGRGIARGRFKTVFRPGFTTKSRGWGLGLSLARRIVEGYHHGHIYVKSSEIGRGTTFAIDLH